MAIARIHLLSTSEKDRIHAQSVDILERVGIHFGSEKALEILHASGCIVNQEDGSARIPSHVVQDAMRALPSKFLLAAPDPANDITCGGEELFYTSAGQSPWFRDLETRERRASTSEDLIKCTQFIEVTAEVSEYAAMVLPTDFHPRLRGLRSLQIVLQYCSKHFMTGVSELKVLPFIKAMLEAVFGDIGQQKDLPLFSLVVEPLSPLRNNGAQVEMALEWAPYMIPISMGAMPLAGATSPATLAGTVLQCNAEFLGNTVFYQLAQPGWPIQWSPMPATLDMRTGRTALGPEAALMSIAMIEMAQYYNVPSTALDICAVDAKNLGFQSGMETIFMGLISALSGVNNLWGPADLDGYTMVDLAHVYLSLESVRQINRLREGICFDDEHLLIDVIKEMGFQGEYLGHPTTKKFFKEEHLLPDIFPRESYEAWQARGQREEDRAIQRVNQILKEHEPIPLPEEIDRELEQIMVQASKQLLE
jgi:trimethylamine--corrinoid protein Co-methyltransferase